MMKQILKWLFFIFIGLLLIITIIGYFYHQPLPEGTKGAEADRLAQKMLNAIDKEGWDSTKWVSWNFSERNTYIWDKERSLVQVNWGDHEVLLEIETQKGKAWKAGQPLKEEALEKAVKTAWAFFCNDSFWLIAPHKAFDPGTERRIISRKDGKKDLLVTYGAGGVTPGDSYLWQLDDQGIPQSYKMWVSIIPIGGIKASWEDWTTTYEGAKIAQKHQLGPLNVSINGLKSGADYTQLGFKSDPFARLLN